MPSIFQDPDPNADETWTHGAMLGGMVGYGVDDLAESYFAAGDALVSAVLNHKKFDARDLIHPILYTYRHGIELYLKAIVDDEGRTHDLAKLLDAFCLHVERRYSQSVPPWIKAPILEFVNYDPYSDVFRYSQSRSLALQAGGEFWVDVRRLVRIMARLRIAFRRTIWADASGEIPRDGDPGPLP